MAVSNKNGIEMGKAKKKTYFFIQISFCPLFCEQVSFLTAAAESCRHCGLFDIGVAIVFYDL